MNKKIGVSIKDCEGIFLDWASKKSNTDAAIKVVERIASDKEIITAGFLVMVGLAKFYNEDNEKVFKQLDEYYQEELIIDLAQI